jgi:hypothetical protein
MDRDLFNGLTTVTLAIVGVAVLAVLVSKNANTSGVLNAYGSSFSQLLGTAEAPVTAQSGSYGSVG